MQEYIQITTTTEKKEDAQRIAKVLVEKRLAGCVQISGPIESTYWWIGKIETAKEWMIFIKTKKEVYAELEDFITNLHPYETPEIIAMPIVEGSKKYLKWLNNEIKEKTSS